MKSLDDMKSIVWFIVLCSSLFGNQKVYSQAGELDPTFGTGGKVSVDFSNAPDVSYSLAVQNNQKLIIAGRSNQSFALARLNSDGSVDQSFGENGKVVQSFGPNYSIINDVLLQKDDKIITIGNVFNPTLEILDVAICRYTSDGKLDPTFGDNGVIKRNLTGSNSISSIGHIQNDGKIIIVGSTGWTLTSDKGFFVIRVNSDGSLDDSFGIRGQKKIDFAGCNDATSVSVSNDGRIYIAGYVENKAILKSEMVICCLNSDGSLNPNFATNGILRLVGYEASDLLITPSNEILVSGHSVTEPGYNFALIKLSADGNLINSFGKNGKVITYLDCDRSYSQSIALQSDGKIIELGNIIREGDVTRYDFGIVRHFSDGSLDKGFGENGVVISKFTRGSTWMTSGTIQIDDKIVVVGQVLPETKDFLIARYLTKKELTVSNDTIVCLGYLGDLTLEASDGFPSYQWVDSLHPSVELGSEKTLTIKPLETTTYGVISGTDTAYCKVTVDNLPIKAQFSMDEKEGNVIFRPIIVNESVGGELYSWDFGNTTKIAVSDAEDLDIQRKYYPIYGYTGEFNIRLDVVRSSGCKDSAFAQVLVGTKPQVNPTAFTPNGDELNDTFNFKIPNAMRIEGSIYNRWGQKIYSMKANSNVFYWDGSQNGLASPMGYYIYSLKSSDIRGEIKTITGRVLLVR